MKTDDEEKETLRPLLPQVWSEGSTCEGWTKCDKADLL